MSRKRKDKIPNLITSKAQIARITGRYSRPRFRPLCSECNNPTMVASIQRGLKKKEPKRDRPPKDKKNNRHERVGHWSDSILTNLDEYELSGSLEVLQLSKDLQAKIDSM